MLGPSFSPSMARIPGPASSQNNNQRRPLPGPRWTRPRSRDRAQSSGVSSGPAGASCGSGSVIDMVPPSGAAPLPIPRTRPSQHHGGSVPCHCGEHPGRLPASGNPAIRDSARCSGVRCARGNRRCRPNSARSMTPPPASPRPRPADSGQPPDPAPATGNATTGAGFIGTPPGGQQACHIRPWQRPGYSSRGPPLEGKTDRKTPQELRCQAAADD
jgi:hypothetical protein